MKRSILIIGFSVLLQATSSWAAPVIRDGNEWLQPVDFMGLSWDDVALVCDSGSGACNGLLNGITVTGYTWATTEDMNNLFNSYGVSPPLSGIDRVFEFASTWAPAVLGEFTETEILGDRYLVWGWARDSSSDIRAYCPQVIDYTTDANDDSASTEHTRLKNDTSLPLGVWLYRATAATTTTSTTSSTTTTTTTSTTTTSTTAATTTTTTAASTTTTTAVAVATRPVPALGAFGIPLLAAIMAVIGGLSFYRRR